jgi:hypothetical protein
VKELFDRVELAVRKLVFRTHIRARRARHPPLIEDYDVGHKLAQGSLADLPRNTLRRSPAIPHTPLAFARGPCPFCLPLAGCLEHFRPKIPFVVGKMSFSSGFRGNHVFAAPYSRDRPSAHWFCACHLEHSVSGAGRQGGRAAAVNPDAFSSLAGSPKTQLNIGKSIFYNERINTTTSGLVQVLLVDGSTFTVGLALSSSLINQRDGRDCCIFFKGSNALRWWENL